jgi:hypothetical protein
VSCNYSKEGRAVKKSWKSRLVMVLTILAVVLAVSVPALADDMQVTCEGNDGSCTLKCDSDADFCEASVDSSSDHDEDADSAPPEDAVDPASVDLAATCFPFCGFEWPW